MKTIEEEIKTKGFKNPFNRITVNVIFTGNWLTDKHTQHVLKPYQLTVEQYNVLRILRGQSPNPLPINGILERMMNRMSNVSRLIDKLLEKGLVSRRESVEDRRSVDIRITQLGLNLLTDIDVLQDHWEENYSGLTEEEAITLSHLLDKMRDFRMKDK